MVPNNMDALEWLRKHLDAEGSDLLGEMVRTFAERLVAWLGPQPDVSRATAGSRQHVQTGTISTDQERAPRDDLARDGCPVDQRAPCEPPLPCQRSNSYAPTRGSCRQSTETDVVRLAQ
jgi:hypothetical protein